MGQIIGAHPLGSFSVPEGVRNAKAEAASRELPEFLLTLLSDIGLQTVESESFAEETWRSMGLAPILGKALADTGIFKEAIEEPLYAMMLEQERGKKETPDARS